MLNRSLIALLCLLVSAGSVLAIEKKVRASEEGELLDAVKADGLASDDEGEADEDAEEAPAKPVAKAKASKRVAAKAAKPAGEDEAIDAEPSTMSVAQELVESAAEPEDAPLPKASPLPSSEAAFDEAEALAAAAKAKALRAKKDKAARQAAARRAAAVFDEPGAVDAPANTTLKIKPKKETPAEPAVEAAEATVDPVAATADAAVGAIALPPSKAERAAKAEADAEAKAAGKAEKAEKAAKAAAKSKAAPKAAETEPQVVEAEPKLVETEPKAASEALPKDAIAKDESAKAEPIPAPRNDPASVRARAFASPLTFTSKGQIKAFMIKINRDLHYTFKPVREGGVVTAIDLKMVDRANDDKTTEGRAEITSAGTLSPSDPALTNACNVALIDPAIHAKLKTDEGPIETRGTMELQGSVLPLSVKHRRLGPASADGSMTVESQSDSDDGRVHTKTITQLAADGLPLTAETTGTVAKGPINLNVNLKLQRESGHASVE